MKGTSRSSKSFRIGKVRGDLRGQVWYLTYHENGVRHRPRVGPDRKVAQQLAAQINGQLAAGMPAALSFEPVSISELRHRWLDHHEHVARSSVQTIRRYRAATQHLLNFLQTQRVPQQSAQFRVEHAEQFVRYLRTIQVPPNGHPHAQPRPLLDKGIRFILETCRAMFNFAVKRRHLSPYAENPFAILQLDRIPIEDHRPVVLFSSDQERQFLEACDDWQFTVFLTLMLTGLRPGELTRLLLPDDLDFRAAMIRVRNKQELGWQVKTRLEREIPLPGVLQKVLALVVGDRNTGPVFLRRRFTSGERPLLHGMSTRQLQEELQRRIVRREADRETALSRQERQHVAQHVWRDCGALKTDRIRREYMRVCERIGTPELTSPKMLRHLFATCLQDANVDPLIRMELMGHSVDRTLRDGGLGMTATYTHTRPETKRMELERALANRSALQVATQWLHRKRIGRA
jgi:integrase